MGASPSAGAFCQIMGGDITVESESGRELTFTIRLPRTGATSLTGSTTRSRCRAGRSVLPPEKPPSSYLARRRDHPACAYLRM
jgi:hypothetical protein